MSYLGDLYNYSTRMEAAKSVCFVGAPFYHCVLSHSLRSCAAPHGYSVKVPSSSIPGGQIPAMDINPISKYQYYQHCIGSVAFYLATTVIQATLLESLFSQISERTNGPQLDLNQGQSIRSSEGNSATSVQPATVFSEPVPPFGFSFS